MPASQEESKQTGYTPSHTGAQPISTTNGAENSDSEDVIHGLSPVAFSTT